MGAAIAGELFLFAVCASLAALYLRRRPEAGLFEPLLAACLPLAGAALLSFVFFQRPGPALDRAKALQAAQMEEMAKAFFPKPEQAAERDEFRKTSLLLGRLTPVFPGLEFILHLSALAAFTVFLRRRLHRLGRAPAPAPLAQWTAPYPLAWLVLAPAAWLLASKHGLFSGPAWLKWLAWNLEVVGLGIFFFQGLVVAGAKLTAWSRDPQTRVLALLALAGAALLAVAQDARPLVSGLLLLGLFEPWMDFRRLLPKAGGPTSTP